MVVVTKDDGLAKRSLTCVVLVGKPNKLRPPVKEHVSGLSTDGGSSVRLG